MGPKQGPTTSQLKLPVTLLCKVQWIHTRVHHNATYRYTRQRCHQETISTSGCFSSDKQANLQLTMQATITVIKRGNGQH